MEEQVQLLKEPAQGVPEVIATISEYHDYCRALAAGTGSVAADAERASGFRYSHEDWLIQLKREGAGIGLLDPIALQTQGVNWDELNQAVGDATWILHDALQDLPGFVDLSIRPLALFDTELAARLLGLKRFGLSSVTEHFLGLTLAKEHSAADWSYRPLPRDWRNYAALDVELLIELQNKMQEALRTQGKMGWAQEEFAYLLAEGMKQKLGHPHPWLRISHINVLMNDHVGLMIAKMLWTKRDELARAYDIAPALLLADRSIIQAGQVKPRNMRTFRTMRCFYERVRIRTGCEQDKMFERYAPIQRKIRPTVWKEAIEEAFERLEKGERALSDLSQVSHTDGGDLQGAPRSMKYWREHHPARFERLQRGKATLLQIAQDTHTPVEVLLKPQILRNLCWQEDLADLDVEAFLRAQGARAWQVSLLAESVSRAII